jgi:2-phosphosulfolactate phosphatase
VTRVRHVTLAEAGRYGGVVVGVDVLRAFTVAALALAAGARAVRCVATVEEALAAGEASPGSVVAGEVGGRRPPGFDLGNSPAALQGADISGRVLIQRTSAGTQGLVAAAGRATALFAAAFVCAGATARAVAALDPDDVTFVLTGVDHRDGDEDRACADYLGALLAGEDVDAEPYLRRVWRSDAARPFLRDDDPDLPAGDLEQAVRLDAVRFPLRAHVEQGRPVLRRTARVP